MDLVLRLEVKVKVTDPDLCGKARANVEFAIDDVLLLQLQCHHDVRDLGTVVLAVDLELHVIGAEILGVDVGIVICYHDNNIMQISVSVIMTSYTNNYVCTLNEISKT